MFFSNRVNQEGAEERKEHQSGEWEVRVIVKTLTIWVPNYPTTNHRSLKMLFQNLRLTL